nr:uncharacterized protein LOC113713785 [Coffea arabica]
MGVIHRVQDQYQFASPGELRLRSPARITMSPAAVPTDTLSAEEACPSTSLPGLPSKRDAQFQSLHAQIQRLDSRIANIELQSSRMAENLAAYFVSVGFSSPFAPHS